MRQWDISNFPFDEQRLQLVIEDAENDTSQMVYIADTINSKLDPCLVERRMEDRKFYYKR